MDDKKLAQLSVLTSLNNMMKSSRFDICCVRDAVKALGTVPDESAMRILAPIHCVNWSDIPAELKAAIPSLIERCIGVPAYQFTHTEIHSEVVESTEQNVSRLFKLLGVE